MTKHMTGTRKEWLAARLELLEAEKELTRRSDELARRRQELPWVRVDKAYRFETDQGSASLADLFRGRSQLLVYHFRRISGGWGGRFPGRLRATATSTSISTSRSPRSNSARGPSITTTSAAATLWTGRRPPRRSPSSRRCAEPTRPPTRAIGRA